MKSAKKTPVIKAPITSFKALSLTAMCFTLGWWNKSDLKLGIIAAGSVDANDIPSKTMAAIGMVIFIPWITKLKTRENVNAVITVPKKASDIIGPSRLRKRVKGVSRPPPKRINVAPTVVSIERAVGLTVI